MRALFRLARREAGRHKLRSALVTVLIGLPVAAGVIAVVVGPIYIGPSSSGTGADEPDGTVAVLPVRAAGSASGAASADEVAAGLQGTLAAIEQAAPGSTTIVETSATVWVPSSDDPVEADADRGTPVRGMTLRGVLPEGPTSLSPGSMTSGRPPVAPGEVVLDEATATALEVDLGDHVEVALPTATLEVVGTTPSTDSCEGCLSGAVTAAAFDTAFAGGWSSDDRWANVLVQPPTGMSTATLRQQLSRGDLGLSPLFSPQTTDTTASERAWARLWTTVGVVFALIWTGLIAATGLAVGARRRQRELGLLAANGADPAQLRAAVVAEGAVVGLVGAVGGAAVGLVAAWALVDWVRRVLWPDAAGPDVLGAVPWVAALVLCGAAAAIAASRAAAAGLNRSTPNDLLRGRRRAPRPAPHWFGLGLGSLAIGFALTRVVAVRSGDTDPGPLDDRLMGLYVTATLGAVTVGLVATAVGASRLLPRLTSWLGPAGRLTGRDLARHGMRVGASCGAVALTLTAAIGIATLYEDARDTASIPRSEMAIAELSPGQRYLEVGADGSRLVGDQVVAATPAPTTGADLRRGGFAALGVSAYFAPAGLQMCPSGAQDAVGCGLTFLLVVDDTSALRPDLRSALDAGLPATVRSGGASLQLDGVPIDSFDVAAADAADASRSAGDDTSGWSSTMLDPNSALVTGRGAAELGIDASQPPLDTKLFVVAPEDDLAVEAQLEQAVDTQGLRVTDTYPPDRMQTWWFVAGGVGFVTIVTLLVVLFALALMRIESRGDDAVLAVVGASPSLSRRIQSARGAAMVLMAAIPAAVVGWGTVRVLVDEPVPVPWWAMAIALVALPLLVAVLAGLTDRPGRRLRLG